MFKELRAARCFFLVLLHVLLISCSSLGGESRKDRWPRPTEAESSALGLSLIVQPELAGQLLVGNIPDIIFFARLEEGYGSEGEEGFDRPRPTP